MPTSQKSSVLRRRAVNARCVLSRGGDTESHQQKNKKITPERWREAFTVAKTAIFSHFLLQFTMTKRREVHFATLADRAQNIDALKRQYKYPPGKP